MKIAIIGAGLSGIVAAKTLTERLGKKAQIQVFEKSRGAGGRMSTRRTDEFEFDHGAQYFTAKDPIFQAAVDAAITGGFIAPWYSIAKYLKDGNLEDDTGGARYVSTPRMNSWIKSMAEDLDIETSVRVKAIIKDGHSWTLQFAEQAEQAGFDIMICSAPSPQAQMLLAPAEFNGLVDLQSAKMDVCFAVMLGFNRALNLPWDTLRSKDGPASWIAINSAKPGRPESGSALMIHSGPNWSNTFAETDKTLLQRKMIEAASELVGVDLTTAAYSTIHRWLYAAVSKGVGQPCLTDSSRKIVACGDWCLGGRVEGAWLSGKAAAEQVLSWA